MLVLWRGTQVFHQKSLFIAGQCGEKREGGVIEPFLADRAGFSPWLQGRAGVSIRLRWNGWKTCCLKFLGVLPSSSSLHSLEASQILQGPAESLSVLTWGTVLPSMLGSLFLRPSEGLRRPFVGPCQSCSAQTLFSPFPLFNLFS